MCADKLHEAWIIMLLAMCSMFTNQQPILSELYLNRNTHKSGLCVNLFIFAAIAILFSRATVSLYIPTINCNLFLHILMSCALITNVDFSYSERGAGME